jgi:hypothetical protein
MNANYLQNEAEKYAPNKNKNKDTNTLAYASLNEMIISINRIQSARENELNLSSLVENNL